MSATPPPPAPDQPSQPWQGSHGGSGPSWPGWQGAPGAPGPSWPGWQGTPGAPGPSWQGAHGTPNPLGMPPGPSRPHPLPWLALAFGIASPAATLASGIGGLVGLSSIVGLPDVSSIVAWVFGLAAVVLGIVSLAQRRRPSAPAIVGMVLPVAGHAVLLGLWVLVFVGVMTLAGIA